MVRFCAVLSFADTLREAIRPDRPIYRGGIAPTMAMASVESPNMLAVEPSPGSKTALPMVIVLFSLWGFIACLNDILAPHLKHLFTLNYAEVMLVQTFFFAGRTQRLQVRYSPAYRC